MIFSEDGTIACNKKQLAALAEVMCKDPERINLRGVFVDPKNKRLASTDGFRLLVVAPSQEEARAEPGHDAVTVPVSIIEDVLRLAKQTALIVISVADKKISVWILDGALQRGAFPDGVHESTKRWRESPLAHRIESAPSAGVFPPLTQALPQGDWSRKEGVAVVTYGSKFLATLAKIGEAVSPPLNLTTGDRAKGAVVRMLIPKRKLDPVLCVLPDELHGVGWTYLLMPLT